MLPFEYCEPRAAIIGNMAAATTLISDRHFPVLPAGWEAEGDIKRLKTLSPGVHRSLEPVGPQYLAHARRMRHNRTFSEDDRIEAEARAKKVDDGDNDGDISEPEDPSMLLREAKDWKVCTWLVEAESETWILTAAPSCIEPRSLCCPWPEQVPL